MLTWLRTTYQLNAGSYRLIAGRFDDAVAHFSAAIQHAPDHPAAYTRRGMALLGMDEHRRAIDDFDRALAIGIRSDRRRAIIHGSRGFSWKVLGDFERAAADYEQALAIVPQFSAMHQELGDLASQRHDFDAAVAHLDQAVRLSPRNASHYKMRGLARFNAGNFAAAETDLRWAVNIADDPCALLFWYLASLKLGRGAAEEFASRARRLNARKWPFPIIALFLGKTGDDAVRAAARTDDERAGAEFYIGEWHLHSRRRRDEAIAALQVAAKSCPRAFAEHTAAVMELKRQRVPLGPDEPPDETSPAVPAHEAAAQSGAGYVASP
jgi:lipoprotein NlpI